MNELYKNKDAVSGLDDDYYWSSTESGFKGWGQKFNGSDQGSVGEYNAASVRAVRAINDLDRQIIIPAGQTSATLTITGIDDAIDESDETIILTPTAS